MEYPDLDTCEGNKCWNSWIIFNDKIFGELMIKKYG